MIEAVSTWLGNYLIYIEIAAILFIIVVTILDIKERRAMSRLRIHMNKRYGVQLSEDDIEYLVDAYYPKASTKFEELPSRVSSEEEVYTLAGDIIYRKLNLVILEDEVERLYSGNVELPVVK
jgi:hypothetical protein